MFENLSALLSDQKSDLVFKCFDLWHIGFILFFAVLCIMICLYLRKCPEERRTRVITALVSVAFGLYMLDFFLMPFAYGAIDTEKLPFHICTTMCVMCFISRHNAFFGRFKLQFAALGFLSNLVYLIYPAGMMWLGIHPLSYRVVQTLLFHGVMMVYGLQVLVYEGNEFCWKKCYKDLAVVAGMTLWALLGNSLYNSDKEFFNWFFVVRDPFNMFPAHIAPFVMPFLNTALFFSVEMLIYFVICQATKSARRARNLQ